MTNNTQSLKNPLNTSQDASSRTKRNNTVKKKRSKPKFSVAIIKDGEIVRVQKSFSEEAQQRIFDEYQSLGYDVEKGFIQPMPGGKLIWRKARSKQNRKKGFTPLEIKPERIK